MSSSGLGSRAAVVIVFATSAAVLVLEILAGRLLAPYVGVSLETYTGIIGTVLAAIAAGTALGGKLADRVDPRRLLGPTLIIGGVLAWLSLPLLSLLGPTSGDGPLSIVVLTAWAFFLPAAVLSAASPMVAKLRLHDLHQTGSVVGGLSAAGTAGALFGTFATGFILVAAMPTRPIVLGVGAGLVAGGLLLWWRFATTMPTRPTAAVVFVAVVGSLGIGAANPTSCQWETGYYCVNVEHDPFRADGRVLHLDTMRHSYVDLADPTHLEFRYVQHFAAVAATLGSGPIDTLHIGGGGFTFPRYLAATRAGGANVAIEIDDELVRIAEERLGLVQGTDLEVLVGDARGLLRRQPSARFDLVVGDAFGGMSVPWHLTTSEFVGELDRVMRPGGIYVLNVIDGGPVRFARAQTATLLDQFDHVVVIAPVAQTSTPSNYVLVASRSPIGDLGVAPTDATVLRGSEVLTFADGARVLVDDFAPVDQLLSRG